MLFYTILPFFALYSEVTPLFRYMKKCQNGYMPDILNILKGCKDLQTPLTDKKGQEDLLTEEVCFALRV